jgi:hypothetical protein
MTLSGDDTNDGCVMDVDVLIEPDGAVQTEQSKAKFFSRKG